MLLSQGEVNGNDVAVVSEISLEMSQPRLPNRKTFETIERRLGVNAQHRKIVTSFDASLTSVWQILPKQQLHPFHGTSVRDLLLPQDIDKCMNFAQLLMT